MVTPAGRGPSPSTLHQPKPVFFIPCLRGFRRQLARVWNSWAVGSSTANSWSRLPVYDDWEALCITAARAYLHLHHHLVYQAHGLATPLPNATRMTVRSIWLPPYVLSMLRELARPMTLDSHTLLVPYLPLVTSDEARGQGPAPPLGLKLPRDPQAVMAVSSMVGGFGALVPLAGDDAAAEAREAQALSAPCPAFICREDGRSLAVFSGRTLGDVEPFPAWRLEAVAVLRHLRPDCVWIAACDLSDAAWSVEGLRSPEGVRFYRCDQDIPLAPEEDPELDGGSGVAGGLDGSVSASGSRSHHHHHQQEGEGRVLASMPVQLQHLLASDEGDAPAYVVPIYSEQGAEVWTPFPTHPPQLEGGGGGEGRGSANNAKEGAASSSSSLDVSGRGGRFWRRR